jgi:hypothetical protein
LRCPYPEQTERHLRNRVYLDPRDLQAPLWRYMHPSLPSLLQQLCMSEKLRLRDDRDDPTDQLVHPTKDL